MSELYHHGILGQKWGVRRYQNEDGTYTDEGLKRKGSSGSNYTSHTTKKVERRLAKVDKKYEKAKSKYAKITGKKYVENEDDKNLKAYNARQLSANKELDQKVRDIRNEQSKGAKLAKYALYGPIGASAYDSLRAQGYSKTKAYVTEALTGPLGASIIASHNRKKAVNAELNKFVDDLNNKKEEADRKEQHDMAVEMLSQKGLSAEERAILREIERDNR